MNGDVIRYCFGTLASDRLALARGERCEELLEAGVTCILPMKLTMCSLQVTQFTQQRPFGFLEKRDVDGGGTGSATDFRQATGKRFAHYVGLRAGTYQQAAASSGGERHRDLK